MAFPVLAEKYQESGLEKGVETVEVSPSEIPNLPADKNQNELSAQEMISMTKEGKIVSLISWNNSFNEVPDYCRVPFLIM